MNTAPMDEDTWIHLQETVRMLQLAVAQIEASILDSEASFNRLAGNFTAIVSTAQTAPDLVHRMEELHSRLMALQNDVQKAVMDFQFFDRLAQRLSHVKESLQELGDTLQTHPEGLRLTETWERLQHNLKSRYTMQCEREMFDMMLEGGTVEEALAHYREHYLQEKAAQQDSGDIDLF